MRRRSIERVSLIVLAMRRISSRYPNTPPSSLTRTPREGGIRPLRYPVDCRPVTEVNRAKWEGKRNGTSSSPQKAAFVASFNWPHPSLPKHYGTEGDRRRMPAAHDRPHVRSSRINLLKVVSSTQVPPLPSSTLSPTPSSNVRTKLSRSSRGVYPSNPMGEFSLGSINFHRVRDY